MSTIGPYKPPANSNQFAGVGGQNIQVPTTPKPAGRSIKTFCLEAGISHAWFYELLKKCPDKLEVVKVFRKTVVLTDPREFLESFRSRAA